MPEMFVKDPDAVKDYTFNWDAWLAPTETIDLTTVVSATGLTVDSYSIVGRTVVCWLSGGTEYTGYEVTCHIETSQGRADDKTMFIACRNV